MSAYWVHDAYRHLLRPGTRRAGLCIAGSTGCVPSRGALWTATLGSLLSTVWSCNMSCLQHSTTVVNALDLYTFIAVQHTSSSLLLSTSSSSSSAASSFVLTRKHISCRLCWRLSRRCVVRFAVLHPLPYRRLCLFIWHSPEVFLVEKVPSGCMAHDLSSIRRTTDHRVVPELFRHWNQAEGREKFLGDQE